MSNNMLGIKLDADGKVVEVYYELLQHHQQKFYETVDLILQLGIIPTPRVVNEALGKARRTSWNAPLVYIRTYLLNEYGYERVFHSRYSNFRECTGYEAGVWRWEKKSDSLAQEE